MKMGLNPVRSLRRAVEGHLLDVVRGVRPGIDHLVVALAVGDDLLLVLLGDLIHLVLRLGDDRDLLGRDDQIVDADRDPGHRRVLEADVLQPVEETRGDDVPELPVALAHQPLEVLLAEGAVQELDARRQRFVEDDPADRGVDELSLVHDLDARMEIDRLVVIGAAHFLRRPKELALALRARLLLGEVVAAEHDVLRGRGDRPPARRQEDVLGRHHELADFDLRLEGERHVHRHLVPVEVGVERRADQGVDADRLALDQDRLEGLDPESMEGRRPVQHHRVILDDLPQDVPHLGPLALDELLRALHRLHEAAVLEPLDDERLEELERHVLREPALAQLELRPDDDHRAPGVVDALSEQVLAEATLLPLEHVGERLERAVALAAHGARPPPVVEQCIHRFLEHALLVAEDDLRRLDRHELLQPVVAVDHPPIEVVQVGRGKAPAVERDERPEIRRQDRDHGHDHPLGAVPALPEGLHGAEALQGLLLPLERGLDLGPLLEPGGHVLQVHGREQLADRLAAHLGGELVVRILAHLLVLVLGEELPRGERRVPRIGGDVGLVVEHALEIAHRHLEQMSDPRRHALEVPDVAHRHGELDVAEPLAPHLGLSHFHAAAIADHAAVADALVLPAVALPVLDRTEDALAEEPVLLRLERPVVDRLGFGHLARGPGADRLRRGELDADGVEAPPHLRRAVFDPRETEPPLGERERGRSEPGGRLHQKTSFNPVPRISPTLRT